MKSYYPDTLYDELLKYQYHYLPKFQLLSYIILKTSLRHSALKSSMRAWIYLFTVVPQSSRVVAQ